MTPRACKVLATLILSLLLAACQPIQPAQPAEPAAEVEAAAEPALVEHTFPTAGVTVSLPEDWIFRYETLVPVMEAWSALPPPERRSGPFHWGPVLEEPIAGITFYSTQHPATMAADLANMLETRFKVSSASWQTVDPVGEATAEEPELLTVNGQQAARMVVEGTDATLRKPFRAYVYAIRNGGRIVYISAPLLEANEAAFVPLIDRIVQTVVVSDPQSEPRQAPEVIGEIAPGTTVSGTLRSSPSDKMVRDYWHFAAKGGKRYVATVTPAEPYSDILITIVNDAGAVRAGTEFYGELGQPKMVEIKPRTDGDYYIAIRNFFLDQGGYTLELQEAE